MIVSTPPLSRPSIKPPVASAPVSFMQAAKGSKEGGHSFLSRTCAFFGGSHFSLLLLILQLATIALAVGIIIVYGGIPTPDPKPFSTDPWIWVSPANSTHVAITVRAFGSSSDFLYLCKVQPTSSVPCSSSNAVKSISIPAVADGTGLFKTIVGGLSQGTKYFYQVCAPGLPTTTICTCSNGFADFKIFRSEQGHLALFPPLQLQEQISNSRRLLAPPLIKIPMSCAPSLTPATHFSFTRETCIIKTSQRTKPACS